MSRIRLASVLAFVFLLAAPVAARAGEPPPAGPSPDEALARLREGNDRFVKGALGHPHQNKKRLDETSGGQHPFATVLSCSDSRVPPEVVFDEGIGDIFSIRVAGNVAANDEMGSAEYGAGHLGTPLLVVLGHTKCGAVTAVATHATVHGHIPALVAPIGPAVEAARKKMPEAKDQELVPEAIKANVFETIAHLLKDSEELHERAANGKTQIVGAVYDIASGKVEWLGHHPDEAALLAEKPKSEHGKKDEHAAKDDHGKKDEHEAEHGAKDEHGKLAETPAPAGGGGTSPVMLAIVALLCTLGGAVSGHLSNRNS